MRKSTTRMLSMILAFLLAFSSLSMPSVAAEIDTNAVVVDETVEVDEDVIETVSEEAAEDADQEEIIEEDASESDVITEDTEEVTEEVIEESEEVVTEETAEVQEAAMQEGEVITVSGDAVATYPTYYRIVQTELDGGKKYYPIRLLAYIEGDGEYHYNNYLVSAIYVDDNKISDDIIENSYASKMSIWNEETYDYDQYDALDVLASFEGDYEGIHKVEIHVAESIYNYETYGYENIDKFIISKDINFSKGSSVYRPRIVTGTTCLEYGGESCSRVIDIGIDSLVESAYFVNSKDEEFKIGIELNNIYYYQYEPAYGDLAITTPTGATEQISANNGQYPMGNYTLDAHTLLEDTYRLKVVTENGSYTFDDWKIHVRGTGVVSTNKNYISLGEEDVDAYADAPKIHRAEEAGGEDYYQTFWLIKLPKDRSYSVNQVMVNGDTLDRSKYEFYESLRVYPLHGDNNTEDSRYSGYLLGVSIYGEYSNRNEVKVRLLQLGENGVEEEYMLTKTFNFVDNYDVSFGPVITSGTHEINLEYSYCYKEICISSMADVDSISFVNAKGEKYPVSIADRYDFSNGYSPEFERALVIKTSNGYETNAYPYFGQYSQFNCTLDASEVPNGVYNVEITTKDERTTVVKDYSITVKGSEVGYEDLSESYGYYVPDVPVDNYGSGDFYAILYAPEIKGLDKFKANAKVKIDGADVNYTIIGQDFIGEGFIYIRSGVNNLSLGEHTFKIILDDTDDVIGSGKSEGTFNVVKAASNMEKTEAVCKATKTIARVTEKPAKLSYYNIPLDYDNYNGECIEKVEAVSGDKKIEIPFESLRFSYISNSPDWKVNYKGEEIPGKFNPANTSVRTFSVTCVIDKSFECGDYDFRFTTNKGKVMTLTNALCIRNEDEMIESLYLIDSSNTYYCDPYSDYISLGVYSNNKKLLNNAPILFMDAELTEPAAMNVVAKANLAENAVVYKYEKEDVLKGNNGNITLYAAYKEGTVIANGTPVKKGEDKVVFSYPLYFSPTPVTKTFLTSGTNKMFKIYISDGYESEIAANDYLVNLKAVAYGKDYKQSGQSTIVTYAKKDNNNRLVIDIPTGSDFYTTVAGSTSAYITMKVGEDSYTLWVYPDKLNKITNISVAEGTWKIVDPFNWDVALAEGKAGEKLDASQVLALSEYSELKLIITNGSKITEKLIQIISPAKDTIQYILGDEYVENENATEVVKGGKVVLNPVTRNHYEFVGWYLDAAFTKPVSEITGAGGKTVKVYAKWVPNTYKVSVHVDGDGEPFTYDVKWGETFEAIYKDISDKLGDDRYVKNWKIDDVTISEDNISGFTLENFENDITENELTIYAQWLYVEYAINYNLSGVSKDEYSNYIGDSFKKIYTIVTDSFEPRDPLTSPAGMRFAGWYADSKFSEKVDSLPLVTEKNADVTLFAKWVPNTYVLRFNDNVTSYEGAKLTTGKRIDDMTLNVGEVVTLPANVFTVEPSIAINTSKYVFRGWSASSAAEPTSKVYSAKEIVCFTAEDLKDAEETEDGTKVLNLYACYAVTQKSKYEVNCEFDLPEVVENSEALSGACSLPKITEYEYGKVTKLPTPSIPGYDFAGWINEATGKKVTSITEKDAGDISLKATWNERTYKVVVKRNGAKGKDYTWTVKFTDHYNYGDLKDVYTRDGYEFAGWELYGPDGTKLETLRDSVAGIGSMNASVANVKAGSKFTYKATWTPITYSITFDSMGGSSVGSAEYQYSTSTMELPVPTKIGYTFLGWASDEEGKKIVAKYNSKTKKALLPAKSFGDKTLYAAWSGSYSIILHNSTGKIKTITGYKLGVAKALPKTPFGASRKQSGKGQDVNGNEVNYSWTYVPSGWKYSPEYDAQVVYGEAGKIKLTDETKLVVENNKLVLHLYMAEYNSKYSMTDSNGNVTQSQNYGNKYTVRFIDATGDVNRSDIRPSGTMKDQTGTIGKTIKLNKNKYTSTNAVFMGWSTNQSKNKVYYKDGAEFCNSIGVDANDVSAYVYLFAVWQDTFTITFNKNSDAAVDGNVTSYDYKYGYTMDTATLKKVSSPTRDGYTFVGWYTDAKCKKAFKGITKKTSGNFTLYAKWTPDKYTIKYIKTGAKTTGTMKDQSCKIGSKVTLSKCAFKNPGYTFAGWNINGKTVSSVKYDSAEALAEDSADETTILAQPVWKPIMSTITFKNVEFAVNNNIEKATAEHTMDVLADGRISYQAADGFVFENAERLGYAFGGWYTDSKCTKPITKIAAGSKSKKTTVYAKWIKITE